MEYIVGIATGVLLAALCFGWYWEYRFRPEINSLLRQQSERIISDTQGLFTGGLVEYHQDRLLPALTVFSSSRSPFVETLPASSPDTVPRLRPQVLEDKAEIEEIWSKVRATY